MTGSCSSTCLSDIFSVTGQLSQCSSELDTSSDFHNVHTLAYQMLAGIDGVYATVTDHMRLLVKQLRTGHNACMVTSTCHTDCQANVDNNDISVKFAERTFESYSSINKTGSFSFAQDSVQFSFETKHSNRSNLCNTLEQMKFYENVNKVETEESFCRKPYVDKKFLESDVEDFEAITFDEETDCDSLTDFGIKSELENIDWNKSHSDISLSDLPVRQKLVFDSQYEHNLSTTCSRIDKELRKREESKIQHTLLFQDRWPSQMLLSQSGRQNPLTATRDSVSLTQAMPFVILEKNLEKSENPVLCLQNETSRKFVSLDRQLNYFKNTQDSRLKTLAVPSNLKFDNDGLQNLACKEKQSDIFSDTEIVSELTPEKLTVDNPKLTEELIMPESEDLNAFFDTQDSWVGLSLAGLQSANTDHNVSNLNSQSINVQTLENGNCEEASLYLKKSIELGDKCVDKELEHIRDLKHLGRCVKSFKDVTVSSNCSAGEPKCIKQWSKKEGKLSVYRTAINLVASQPTSGSTAVCDTSNLHGNCELLDELVPNIPEKQEMVSGGWSAHVTENSHHHGNCVEDTNEMECTEALNVMSPENHGGSGNYEEEEQDTQDLESFFNNITDEIDNNIETGGHDRYCKTVHGRESHKNGTCEKFPLSSVSQPKGSLECDTIDTHDFTKPDRKSGSNRKELIAGKLQKFEDDVHKAVNKCSETDNTHESDSVYNTFHSSDFDTDLEDLLKDISNERENNDENKITDCEVCNSIPTFTEDQHVLDMVTYSPDLSRGEPGKEKKVPLLSKVLLKPLFRQVKQNNTFHEAACSSAVQGSKVLNRRGNENIQMKSNNVTVSSADENNDDINVKLKDSQSLQGSLTNMKCTSATNVAFEAGNLDECVVLDSQELPLMVKGNNNADVRKIDIAKDFRVRRVQFDSKLLSIRSCELMDIRMKLNKDSPVPCIRMTSPQKTCLKKYQEIDHLVKHLECKSNTGLENIDFSCSNAIQSDIFNTEVYSDSPGTDSSKDLFESFSTPGQCQGLGCRDGFKMDSQKGRNTSEVRQWADNSCSDLFTTFHGTPDSFNIYSGSTNGADESRQELQQSSVTEVVVLAEDKSKTMGNGAIRTTGLSSHVTDQQSTRSMGESRTESKAFCQQSDSSSHDLFADSFVQLENKPTVPWCRNVNRRQALNTLVLNTPGDRFCSGKLDRTEHKNKYTCFKMECEERYESNNSVNKRHMLTPGKSKLSEENAMNVSLDLFEDTPEFVSFYPICDTYVSHKSVPDSLSTNMLCKKLYF